MFAAVYSWRAMGPAVLDPEVGIDFSRLVHGAQDFTWHEPVVAGDEITTEAAFVEQAKRGEIKVVHVQLALGQPARRTRLRGDMDELREVTVTPDRYVTYRYAGASRGLQPDPPGRRVRALGRAAGPRSCTACGRWRRSRASHGEAAGDPLALKSLSVQFRGMGVPEKEITITSKPRGDGRQSSTPRPSRTATSSCAAARQFLDI